MVKIGKILKKTNEWKFHYRFKRPDKIEECLDEDDYIRETKNRNVIAVALDKYNFFLISIIKEKDKLIYVIKELGS